MAHMGFNSSAVGCGVYIVPDAAGIVPVLFAGSYIPGSMLAPNRRGTSAALTTLRTDGQLTILLTIKDWQSIPDKY